MYDWHDLRFFLAVHREGSLTKAGQRLKVDPTTVGRRIGALEAELGPLFVRRRTGWSLTPTGSRILPAAERVEEAALDVHRVSDEAQLEPEGRVRLTTLDVLATQIVAPRLPALYGRHPRLRVDVICTPVQLDLVRGEADLALRAVRPVEDSLVARRVALATERLYASRSFLASAGVAADVEALTGLPMLVTYTDEAFAIDAGARLAMRTSSANVLIAATLSGAGIAMLPDVIAAGHPELVALTAVERIRERPLWLTMHRDLARVARVRAVADFLTETLVEGMPGR